MWLHWDSAGHMGSLITVAWGILVATCGLQFLDQGLEPSTLLWEQGVLTTGPLGRFPVIITTFTFINRLYFLEQFIFRENWIVRNSCTPTHNSFLFNTLYQYRTLVMKEPMVVTLSLQLIQTFQFLPSVLYLSRSHHTQLSCPPRLFLPATVSDIPYFDDVDCFGDWLGSLQDVPLLKFV